MWNANIGEDAILLTHSENIGKYCIFTLQRNLHALFDTTLYNIMKIIGHQDIKYIITLSMICIFLLLSLQAISIFK